MPTSGSGTLDDPIVAFEIVGDHPTVLLKLHAIGALNSGKGAITIALPQSINCTVQGCTIAGSVTIPLDADGMGFVRLPATDTVGMVPYDWPYHVREVVAGSPLRSYAVKIPQELGEVWLAQLPEVDPNVRGFVPVEGPPGPPGETAYQLALDEGFSGTEEEWLTSLHGQQGIQGIQGPPGPDGLTGERGEQGESAYQVALNDGFLGTEDQWLASLVGPKGTAGRDGAPGLTGLDGTDGAPGADGESAYAVAVRDGFAGTEEEWLASLIGPQGDQGQQGPPGTAGEGSGQVATVNGDPGPDVVISVNGQTSTVITLASSDVGAIPQQSFGVANGVATLGADGLILNAQLPSQGNVVNTINGLTGTVVLSADDVGAVDVDQLAIPHGVATLGGDGKLLPAQSRVSSVNGKSGDITLTSSDVGAVDANLVGRAGGIAQLDSTGQVTTQQARIVSVNGKTGVVALASTDVGAVPILQRGAANGVATLDGAGNVPLNQIFGSLPVNSVNGKTGGPVIITAGDVGAIAIATRGAPGGVAALDGNGLVTAAESRVPSVAGRTGNVTLSSADITDSTATGRVLLTASSPSAGLTALGGLAASTRGAASGVAPLDASAQVPLANLPMSVVMNDFTPSDSGLAAWAFDPIFTDNVGFTPAAHIAYGTTLNFRMPTTTVSTVYLYVVSYAPTVDVELSWIAIYGVLDGKLLWQANRTQQNLHIPHTTAPGGIVAFPGPSIALPTGQYRVVVAFPSPTVAPVLGTLAAGPLPVTRFAQWSAQVAFDPIVNGMPAASGDPNSWVATSQRMFVGIG